jgi:hypothetical protein
MDNRSPIGIGQLCGVHPEFRMYLVLCKRPEYSALTWIVDVSGILGMVRNNKLIIIIIGSRLLLYNRVAVIIFYGKYIRFMYINIQE